MIGRILAVLGCTHGGCEQLVMRGEEVGRVVDSAVIGAAEVWQIEWPDGSVYLMSTDEISGVVPHRPPNRPPRAKLSTSQHP